MEKKKTKPKHTKCNDSTFSYQIGMFIIGGLLVCYVVVAVIVHKALLSTRHMLIFDVNVRVMISVNNSRKTDDQKLHLMGFHMIYCHSWSLKHLCALHHVQSRMHFTTLHCGTYDSASNFIYFIMTRSRSWSHSHAFVLLSVFFVMGFFPVFGVSNDILLSFNTPNILWLPLVLML